MTPMADPIRLEVFKHRLTSIAEEMGVVLRRASYSPNIKERRDYSCALFDGQGRMAAQAAHIPVHLGSMPLSVGAAIDAFRTSGGLVRGDAILMNDPFRGGTHLPDITSSRRCSRRTHPQEPRSRSGSSPAGRTMRTSGE